MTQAYPQEIVYIVDGKYDPEKAQMCYRDKDIKNRYWFEFPAEWRTSTRKTRVVGFRGLHIENSTRNLDFRIQATLTHKEDGEKFDYTIGIVEFNYPRQSLEDITEVFKEVWRLTLNYYIPHWEAEGKPVFNEDSFRMYFLNKELNAVVLIGTSPSHDYNIDFTIEATGEDFNKVFHEFEKLTSDDVLSDKKYILYPGWDRGYVMLASSLSNNISKNYLGHDDKDYQPVKYYEVQCEETRFYIDFFHANNQNIPAILPDDFKDKIILEMIIPPE